MKSTELNWRSLPKSPFLFLQCTKSVHLMLRCLCFSGLWLEIPAWSLPPVILHLIRWLDAVNIPFIWILYPSFDLLYVLLPIECMLLIAVFASLKRALFLQVCFSLSWTHDWCVQCETILCEMWWHDHSRRSVLYLGRLVFFSSNMVRNSNMFFVKLCLRVWCFVDKW